MSTPVAHLSLPAAPAATGKFLAAGLVGLALTAASPEGYGFGPEELPANVPQVVDPVEAVRGADHVFFVQKAQHLATVAQHSHARLWVWLHNYLHDEVPYFWRDHLRHRLGIVCVS